jgi:hypothetical protein
VHYVQVSGLDPNAGTKICIRVTSGASQEPAQMVTLGPTIGISSPDSVFGTVKNGTANAGDVIVYMTMTTNGVSSPTITTCFLALIKRSAWTLSRDELPGGAKQEHRRDWKGAEVFQSRAGGSREISRW